MSTAGEGSTEPLHNMRQKRRCKRIPSGPPRKNLSCLPDKRGFLQLSPFLPERVIYLRYDIALRAMIYAFGIWRNGYYIMLAAGKYIIRQRRISYCASDISLKSAAKRNIICSINKNLTVCKVMLRKCKVDAVVFFAYFSYNEVITAKEVLL